MTQSVHMVRAWPLCLAAAALLPLLASCGGGSPAIVDGGAGEGDVITVEAVADIQVLSADPLRVGAVRPVPQTITLPRSGVAIFTATAQDREGRHLTGLKLRWRMRDNRAGAVTEHGVFTAGLQPGVYDDAIVVEAVQRFEDQEASAEGTVSVVVTSGLGESVLGSVGIFPRAPLLRPGDHVGFSTVALGTGGGLFYNAALQWRVTDPQAGAITSGGVFTASQTPGVYEDAVEVEAQVVGQDPVTDRVTVAVLSREELRNGVRVQMAPAPVLGAPQTSRRLTLFAFDFEGTPVPLGEVRWRVAVSRAGRITGDGQFTVGDIPGTYQDAVEATVALAGDYEGRTVTVKTTVVVQRAEDIATTPDGQGRTSLLPTVLRLRPGGSQRLSLANLDGRGIPLTPKEVRWSADPEVATVDDTGRVTAEAPPGTYLDAIRAEVRDETSEDGVVRVATATLVVVGPLSRVDLVPARAVLGPGEVVQFQALAYDAMGERLFNVSFTWEMANDSAGSITSGGTFTAGDLPGEYPGAVRVRARQREP